MNEKYIKNIEFEKVHGLKGLMSYVDGGVESRTLVQRDDFSMTLFSFAKGEGVSSYSMPGDTMIHIYEGVADVIIDDQHKHRVNEGQSIVISENVNHSIDAVEQMKVMIVIAKPQK